ncbi:hypothetical protein [Ornithinimicrobium kibberense]|uniref:hypothetical protein n=1 Tax=Ornithinimicrobium kibberense TaxID=282060 RepID=UPI0036107DDA
MRVERDHPAQEVGVDTSCGDQAAQGLQRVPRQQRGVDPGHHLLGVPGEDLDQDGREPGVVVEEGAAGDPRTLGHLVDGDLRHRVAAQERLEGAGHGLAGADLVQLAPSRGRVDRAPGRSGRVGHPFRIEVRARCAKLLAVHPV